MILHVVALEASALLLVAHLSPRVIAAKLFVVDLQQESRHQGGQSLQSTILVRQFILRGMCIGQPSTSRIGRLLPTIMAHTTAGHLVAPEVVVVKVSIKAIWKAMPILVP
jgi:hypothetical protein